MLRKPFPDGIRVLAGEDSEAQYEAGILTASLPIISEIPETFVKLGKRRTVESSTDTSNDDTTAPAKKKQKVNENTKLKDDKNKNQKNAKNTKQQNKNQKKNNKKDESSAEMESTENKEANKKKKKLPTPMLLPDSTDPANNNKNKKNKKSVKKDESDTTVTSTEELSNKDTSEELSETKKPKQFTTVLISSYFNTQPLFFLIITQSLQKQSAINILESVSSVQQDKINSKLSKEVGFRFFFAKLNFNLR